MFTIFSMFVSAAPPPNPAAAVAVQGAVVASGAVSTSSADTGLIDVTNVVFRCANFDKDPTKCARARFSGKPCVYLHKDNKCRVTGFQSAHTQPAATATLATHPPPPHLPPPNLAMQVQVGVGNAVRSHGRTGRSNAADRPPNPPPAPLPSTSLPPAPTSEPPPPTVFPAPLRNQLSASATPALTTPEEKAQGGGRAHHRGKEGTARSSTPLGASPPSASPSSMTAAATPQPSPERSSSRSSRHAQKEHQPAATSHATSPASTSPYTPKPPPCSTFFCKIFG